MYYCIEIEGKNLQDNNTLPRHVPSARADLAGGVGMLKPQAVLDPHK